MARLYQKIDNEAVPLGGGGGGSVAIDNDTITENSDGEIQVAPALTGKINQLNNVAADMGKVLTANGNGTAEWDDILVPIDYETITKNSDGELQVSSVPYDNTESGLTADNVQDAIDEVNSNFDNLKLKVYSRTVTLVATSTFTPPPNGRPARMTFTRQGQMCTCSIFTDSDATFNASSRWVYLMTDDVIPQGYGISTEVTGSIIEWDASTTYNNKMYATAYSRGDGIRIRVYSTTGTFRFLYGQFSYLTADDNPPDTDIIG